MIDVDLPAISHPIPVIVGNVPDLRNQHFQKSPRIPCRTTVKRCNKALTALSLPNLMVTNHRSIFPKFNNLVDEILENEMHVGLHSEIWQDVTNTAHTNKVEEALELHGIIYISTPRHGRRGGGAAITLIADSPLTITKLNTTYFDGENSLEV